MNFLDQTSYTCVYKTLVCMFLHVCVCIYLLCMLLCMYDCMRMCIRACMYMCEWATVCVCVCAVSYTHLDVYKRQEFILLLNHENKLQQDRAKEFPDGSIFNTSMCKYYVCFFTKFYIISDKSMVLSCSSWRYNGT